jgi:hypothetical protein
MVLFAPEVADEYLRCLSDVGIPGKFFGAPGNPRYYRNWGYIEDVDKVVLSRIDHLLRTTIDVRLPSFLSDEEAAEIGRVMRAVADEFGQ